MNSKRKQLVYDLLKGIETGDPESVKVVNEKKYIQHNPQTKEGGEGLAQLFKRLSKTNPKVEIVRLFEDGDFVFGHTIYDFSSVRIGFEVFRYEGDQVVEHWDNIQLRSGDMVGGSTGIVDLDRTEENRALVKKFISSVLIGKNEKEIIRYIDKAMYKERSTLMDISEKIQKMDYKICHRVLAEGNFILAVNEGTNLGVHSSFYDLFRLEAGKIVEHWDTLEKVLPKEDWQNGNGKF
jgi:predicted SnoaL-like aldol condensation-catalyzing enzyme